MNLPNIVESLKVPYHTQINNENQPYGTCNVTSLAMCLNYYGHVYGYGGVKPSANFGQLEDELFVWMVENGLDRHNHAHLKQCFDHFAKVHKIPVVDNYQEQGTIDMAKKCLASGNPCITAGYFTKSGHIIVLTGYDETGFFVNDPYGERFSKGYDRLGQGEGLHYSYNMIKELCVIDGYMWLHLFDRIDSVG